MFYSTKMELFWINRICLQIQMGRKNVMKSQQRLAEIIFMRIQELHRERCTAYVSGVGRKDISRRFGKKVKYICLFEDYIVYKLTGVRQIDYSLATRTMAFDIYSLEWDTKILDAAEIDVSMLSKVVPIGAKAGNMSLQITEELGFMNRPVIVSGCHDQIAAAIGSGVFNERHGVDGTGTVECITVAFSKGQKIDKMLLQKSGFAIVPYMKDLFVTYAFSYTGGALLKWYRDKVSPMEAKEAYKRANPYEVYTGEFLMENRQNY